MIKELFVLKIKILPIIVIIILLMTGCNKEEYSIKNNITLNDEEHVHLLLKKMESADQIIKELDLLLAEFQQTDELVEALEMMETAKSEIQTIFSKLHSIPEYEDKELKKSHVKFKDNLGKYYKGLELQLKSVENNDAKTMKKGYIMVEEAKWELNNLMDLFNKS